MKIDIKRRVFTYILLSIVVIYNAFILVESIIPGVESAKQSDWVTEVIAYVVNVKPTSQMAFDIRKLVGHFSLFFLNGIISTFFLFFTFKNQNKITLLFISLLFGFLIAVTSELLQNITVARYGTIRDVQIDFKGYLSSSTIMFFVYKLIQYFTSKNSKRRLCV